MRFFCNRCNGIFFLPENTKSFVGCNNTMINHLRKVVVGVLNSIDDVKKVFSYFWEHSKIEKPYNFNQTYPDLFTFEFNNFVENYPKEIRWSENGLCFIVLTDGRVLVGSPRILAKEEDGE